MSSMRRSKKRTASPKRSPARPSRRRPASAEQRLWAHLVRHRSDDLRFQRRVRLEGRVFPFFCPAAQVAVQLDPERKGRAASRDLRFDAYLLAHGILVQHFGERHVRQAAPNVAEQIVATCRRRAAALRPAPSTPAIQLPPVPVPRIARSHSHRVARIIALAVAAILIAWLLFPLAGPGSIQTSPLTLLDRLPTPTLTPRSTETTPSSPVPKLTPPTDRRSPLIPNAIFERAEKDLASQPQAVIDLLLPRLGEFTSKSDLEDAYSYLGSAELQLKHYKAAAGYFNQLYQLEPSAEYLYPLAVAYDLGGDWTNALVSYRALAEWKGVQSDTQREFARRRVRELEVRLATPTP